VLWISPALWFSLLNAQTGWGIIPGTVTDPTGAAIAGAKISLRNEATNVSATLQANAAGDYTLSNLLPNPYEITASATGFQTSVIRHVVLAVSQTVRADAYCAGTI
jgi:hypothetical protein